MSVALNTVWKVAENLMDSPRWVFIKEKAVDALALKIKESLQPFKPCGPPDILGHGYTHSEKDGVIEIDNSRHDGGLYVYRKVVAYELIAGAINYQYWYGRHDIRPNDSSSPQMYKLLTEAFKLEQPIYYCAQQFMKKISLERFPAIEQRLHHIDELFEWDKRQVKEEFDYNLSHMCRYGHWVGGYPSEKPNVADALDKLITLFPGYAHDIFLKRASLFFMQLYRSMGWFKDSIHLLPVPADYQVPKMLHHFGCLEYAFDLKDKILHGDPIISESREEVEIRAATILICKKLAEKAGCTMCDIDTFLWFKRKECVDPFHLTVTTDY